MDRRRCLTFAMMDGPFESARTVTALRLIDAALDRGHNVNVFAYEGARGLRFARQTAHANATHGRDVAQEDASAAADVDRAGWWRAQSVAARRLRVDQLRAMRG